MRFLRVLPVVALLAMAVLGSAQGLGGRRWDPRNQVDFGVVSTLPDSQMGQQGMQVFATVGDLERFWMQATGQPATTAPKVDWLRQTALAVTLGERPSGTSVFVQSIERDGARTVVHAIERPSPFVSPRGKGGRTVRPLVIVSVNRNAGNPVLDLQTGTMGTGGTSIILLPPYGYDPGFGDDCDWDVVMSGSSGLQNDQGFQSFESEDGWNSYWRQRGAAGVQTPKVDWRQYKVVAIFLGSRRTGGYSLRVKDVRTSGTNAMINVVEVQPRPGAMVTQALTSPWVLVRVPRQLQGFRVNLSTEVRGR